MKSKSYKHGKSTYKSYFKKAGYGYEVGVVYKGKPLFVGNFIKSKEANEWYRKMNSEITTFAKRYWATEDTSTAFYTKFLGNHIYNHYYKYINKVIPTAHRQFDKAFNQDLKKYRNLKTNWSTSEKLTFKKAS